MDRDGDARLRSQPVCRRVRDAAYGDRCALPCVSTVELLLMFSNFVPVSDALLRAYRILVLIRSDCLRIGRTAEHLASMTRLCSLQAKAVEPTHLQYRDQWMSPANTADLNEDQVRDRIHEVIKNLDSTFDVPSTAEGLDMLTHVRSHDDVEQVIAWLGAARQYALGHKPGWATPPPSRLLGASAVTRAPVVRMPNIPCPQAVFRVIMQLAPCQSSSFR
jgi:hypothetical protein